MEDSQIIVLLQQRKEEAIDAAREKYSAYCAQIAGNILGNSEDTEEVLNDLWFRVWNTIPPQEPYALYPPCDRGAGARISSGENRAVINRSLFRLLSPSETVPFTVEIPFQMEDGSRILRKVEVVGVCEDLSEVAPYYNSEGILCARTKIYVSQSLFSTEELPRLSQRKPLLLIHSNAPEKAAAYAQQ
ncbi:MAG: hypothetical protein IJC46_06030, partial [Clostridia bacterium]|nr:hypothetical protein [Clostridia bacterium]